METIVKVIYGLTVSSLVLASLAGKTAFDRVESCHTLASVERAMVALAVLEAECGKHALIDWIEDEFADNMQDQGNWCSGTVPEVLSRWDDSRNYEFRGSVASGPGLVFRWTRLPGLNERQKAVRARLKKHDNAVAQDDDYLAYEVLSFMRTPPLLVEHEIWVASGHVVHLNFGESMRLKEWVSYLDIKTGGIPKAYTAADLREHIAALGVQISSSGKDAESIYRSVFATWTNQRVKVPIVNWDLKYTYAVFSLSFLATVQLLWLAKAITSIKINPEADEETNVALRLSLRSQLAAATDGRMAKVITVLDWLAVIACGAVALTAPTLCFLSALTVYLATGTEMHAVYATAGIAAPTLFLSAYVVSRLRKIVGAVSLPTKNAA